MRNEAGPQQKQALLRRALLAQLRAQHRPRAIVGERALDEAAEEQRLFMRLRDQPAREVRRAVECVAGALELLAPVAILRRRRLAKEVAQVEETIDAAQEHLQLEENLLASGDGQPTDPALALGEIYRPHALTVAHELEEEILCERSPCFRHGRQFRATLCVRRIFQGLEPG